MHNIDNSIYVCTYTHNPFFIYKDLSYRASTDVNQKFSDLINHLIFQFSESEKLSYDLHYKLHTLMASSSEQLFTDQFLKKVANCKSFCHFVSFLLPFMSWLDHSVLRELVEASGIIYALKLLDQFDSMIDDNKAVTSYPIPPPGQLIVPLSNSKFTLLATKYDCTKEIMSLKEVRNIKSLMEDKWNITSHALQLVAVCTSSGFLYWMIPECIVTLIQENLKEMRYDLWQCGFITIVLFPLNLYYQEYDCGKEIIGPFSFLSQYDTTKVCTGMYYVCTHKGTNVHTCIQTHTYTCT